MIAIAHFIAISLYFGAAALAATPFARPVRAPVRAVLAVLASGVFVHFAAIVIATVQLGQLPFSGLGPALSFAGFLIAATLLFVELVTRDVALSLVAAPLAGLITAAANIIGLIPATTAPPASLWLNAHIAMSFIGLAALATAAAAGTMYLVERRELKSRRFGAVFRFFPPLDTLDRVNRGAVMASWITLTIGMVLAVSYSVTFSAMNLPQLIWGLAAWVAVSAVLLGRLMGGWDARRSALLSGVAFTCIIVLYLAVRVSASGGGAFL